jgi:hypothetical protein
MGNNCLCSGDFREIVEIKRAIIRFKPQTVVPLRNLWDMQQNFAHAGQLKT